MKRAPLAVLALAALSASGAAAEDDAGGGGATVDDCVDRLKENVAAMEGEVPGFGGRFGVIGTWEACPLADLMGAMVDAKRRGDEAALGALKERLAALERAREERDRQVIDWLFGE